jgi:hypothetical protein
MAYTLGSRAAMQSSSAVGESQRGAAAKGVVSVEEGRRSSAPAYIDVDGALHADRGANNTYVYMYACLRCVVYGIGLDAN